MRNKLTDLNNHLFEQLERLNDDELTEEELTREMKRAKVMTNVAQAIVNNANMMLRAVEMAHEHGIEKGQEDGVLRLMGGVNDERDSQRSP